MCNPKLKLNAFQLTNNHQRLTEHCLQVEDQLNELRKQSTAELSQLQRVLVLELTACVMDVKSLVDVCQQWANNEEPDITALLGVHRMYLITSFTLKFVYYLANLV
jgi:hypothetical protein